MQLQENAWTVVVNDEERGGPFVPDFALTTPVRRRDPMPNR